MDRNEKISIVYIPIDTLKPSEYNPRTWSDAAIQSLTENLKKFGLKQPLLVNNAPGRENIVIGGHFRLKVAKDIGLTEVPVVYVSIADLAEEQELNVRLNKNLGDWNYELLAKLDRPMLGGAGFTEPELKLLDAKPGAMVMPDVQAGGAQTRSITVYYPPEVMDEVEEAIGSHEGANISDKLLALIRSHPDHGEGAV